MISIQETPEFLYHYTSINTLALILANKTICFNNLLHVDDLEEVETEDLDKFGKFCCVSCWSSEATESIPLWNMYTPNMSGVRIKLPTFPFKKYRLESNEMYNEEPIESYIDMKKFIDSNNALVAHFYPELIKVEYTEQEKLLYPKIKTIKEDKIIEEKIINNQKITTTKTDTSITYTTEPLGKYKRTNWSFQNEWRYKIFANPYTYAELKNCKSHEDQQKLLSRLEDPEYPTPYNQFFLELDENYLEGMEIILGPKTTKADEIIVNSLIEKYCPTARVLKSSLKIK